jgi:hypothetical protein
MEKTTQIMAETDAQNTARNGTGIPPKRGGKARLLSLEHDIDRRTVAGKRALELRDRLIAERGGLETMGTMRAVLANDLAVCSAMIESELTRWLRGEAIDVAQLSVLLNCRRRDAALLGIDPDPKNTTITLDDIAREIEEENAERAAREAAEQQVTQFSPTNSSDF